MDQLRTAQDGSGRARTSSGRLRTSADELRTALGSKGMAYPKNVNEAKLMVMNIEAQTFGHRHVPLHWLPKELRELQEKKLGIVPADTAKSKGKEKKKPAFAFGMAKQAADLLTGASAGVQ